MSVRENRTTDGSVRMATATVDTLVYQERSGMIIIILKVPRKIVTIGAREEAFRTFDCGGYD